MTNRRKGILAIKSLKARAAILAFICIPIFVPILRHSDVSPLLDSRTPHEIMALIPFLIYSFFLFSIISYTLGISGLTKIIAISATTAITVSVTRGIIPQIPVIGNFLQGSKPDSDSSFSSALQLVEMFILIPAPIFFIRCVPPADLLMKIRSDKRKSHWVIAAIISRMSTAIIDGVAYFFTACQEENPKFILPRHSAELGSSQKLIKFPLWFVAAMKTWCFALVVYSLEQIPPLIHQTNNLLISTGEEHA